jgi:hypothetical protein
MSANWRVMVATRGQALTRPSLLEKKKLTVVCPNSFSCPATVREIVVLPIPAMPLIQPMGSLLGSSLVAQLMMSARTFSCVLARHFLARELYNAFLAALSDRVLICVSIIALSTSPFMF